jgi:perosamine synthetase
MRRHIPVAAPLLVGNEKAYVVDCLESTWISSNGKYIGRFEEAFANFCNARHAITCCNGTVALHLALMALGVGPGDEVIVPTLTYVATANAVTYCGARPVFVDSEPETWTLNPSLIEENVTPRTKGIIVVHLYGHPVDMDAVLAVARKHGLFVIEDAAEAHGAKYKGKIIGSLGDIATFSFYGNKILTTGEGGMVVTNNDGLGARIRILKGQGMDPDRRYWFSVVGYNYRMTNIAAAIGLAQLEKSEWHIDRRREIAALYIKHLEGLREIALQPEKSWAYNVYWMISAVLSEDLSISRDSILSKLAKVGIETRPFFYPMHALPIYRELAEGRSFPVADRLAARGINLPSSAALREEDIDFVCSELVRLLRSGEVVNTHKGNKKIRLAANRVT